MASFLTASLTFWQKTAEQSFTKGVEYAAGGEFERAKEEFERSLKRLKTDYFDLYQLHGITDVKKDVDRAFAEDGVMVDDAFDHLLRCNKFFGIQ